MIAAWMVYAALVAALLGGGALALERALRLAGRQARWVWVTALAASLVLPLLARTTARRPPSDSEVGVIQVAARAITAPVPKPSPTLASFDTPLIVGWVAASAAVFIVLLASQRALRRQTAGGVVQDVDGHVVCVTPATGPAVVGGLKLATIVLPSWVTELDPEVRRLAVHHEAQHVRAGDVHLLAVAALAAVACPWNPAIWWQVRRLRDAVELDCDHRLVRAGVDVRAYGALLLEVAHRSALGRPGLALAARPSLLSRRIDHMTRVPSRAHRVRAVLGASLGVGLVVLACEAPRPVAETDGSAVAVLAESQVDEPPIRLSSPRLQYPPLLREAGIEGEVVLEFVVDAAGRVDPASIVVISRSHRAFDRAAAEVVQASQFRPAMVGGVPTAVRIRQPVAFRIAK